MAQLRLCALLLLLLAGNTAGTAAGIRIDLRYPGVYRITGAQLAAQGVNLAEINPRSLSLHCAGTTVPILLSGESDDSFNEADTIEFVGSAPLSELLAGDRHTTSATWYMPENKWNVYFLNWTSSRDSENVSAAVFHYKVKSVPPARPHGESKQLFWQWHHWEKDYLYSFSTLPPDMTDNFYWLEFRAGMASDAIMKTSLDFPGFEKAAGHPVDIAARILGKTNAAGLLPSHLFSFVYDKKPIGDIKFDGIAMHTARLAIPAAAVSDSPAGISFNTPEDRKGAVDAIALDSIEARYPSRYDACGAELYTFNNDMVTSGQSEARQSTITVSNLPAGAVVFDSESQMAYQLAPDQHSAVIANTSILTTFTAAAPSAWMMVDHMDPLTSRSALPTIDPHLKVLVIYHPSLQKTADAYTRYRQERGWNVAAVSVRSIFDKYSHGFISDAAVRDYIISVAAAAPGLSHVVLIGDSYFDYREARSYDDPKQLQILIPIHWVYRPGVTWSGGYQDDNWYGSLFNQFRPDVSVGRLPVNSDAQGLEYLRKVIAHETFHATAGDKALFVSSVEKNFQSYVSEIGNAYSDKISTATYLFPQARTVGDEVTNLQREINNGVQLLYYVGHGGSLVWRVGPADFSQQKDLFTPQDVARLTNTDHYPFIVCASCYTTAFDQPQSIGEAFVNQPNAGAIAVIGASWKATVQDSHQFNRLLFKSYFDPTVHTLGEASLKAHREYISPSQDQALYNSFTFLGDPCTEIVRQGDTLAPAAPAITTSTVYRTSGSQVLLLGNEGPFAAGPEPLVEVKPADFPNGKILRNRLLVEQGQIKSRQFLIPDFATTISISSRSRQAGDIFPRLKINLVTSDNNRHKVFEGYWQSVGMSIQSWRLSPYVLGKDVHLEVGILNSGTAEEERTWYFNNCTIE